MANRDTQPCLAAILVAFTIAGCHSADLRNARPAPPAQTLIADRLFFGRNIPAGGTVSDAQWSEFLRAVVTPRFPKGLTVWQGSGQWLDPRGDLVKESVFVVEVFHDAGDEAEASIAAIAAEYKKRFGQDAVLRVSSESLIRFY